MSTARRQVPHDTAAEAQVLGALMLYADAYDEAEMQVGPDDFYTPWHAQVFAAIGAVVRRGEHVEPVAVAHELERSGAEADGPALLGLVGSCGGRGSLRRHVVRLQEQRARRAALAAAAELQEAAYDPTVPTDRLPSIVEEAGRHIALPVSEVEPAPDVWEFVGDGPEPYRWLVPGLLEEGDRLLLTGEEGLGKSTLLRQIGYSVSVGAHPFTARPIEPLRVLVLDLENSKRQLVRAYENLQGRYAHEGYRAQRGMLRIVAKPDGLDLQHPMDVRWLYEQVQAAQPQVLVFGPLYKAGAVGNDEEPARRVLQVLDKVRLRHGCALLMETHSPHGETGSRPLRPVGASIWMRWPEFGYGIRAEKDEQDGLPRKDRVRYMPWRGPRDVRDWPERLRHGRVIPWEVNHGDEPREEF